VTDATLALAALAVTAAYTVFGLTGFGSAMVAVPLLVQLVPLQFAVPMVLLFDLVGTSLVGLRHWRQVARDELRRLLPFMLVGVFIGTTVLTRVSPRWLLIGLGLFVLAMALRSLVAARSAQGAISAGWVVPAGVVGGVFSALFGTGGPVYTLYLVRRVPEAERFRATIATVIFASAVVRLGAFGAMGLWQQPGLLRTALLLMPCVLLGAFLGGRLRRRLPDALVKRLLFLCLAGGGFGVLLRGLATGA
jgi:uncharacterized membrane protein YfcA